MNTVLKIGTGCCPPCRLLKPIYNKLEEKYKDRICFLEVSDDGDYNLFEKFSRKFNIRSVPVVMIINSEENEMERITGLYREKDYCEMIEKYL